MIFNMNGVNYDTDTFRTDEEINALISTYVNANPDACVVTRAGTGKSGSSYPCSITFPFAPSVVIWLGKVTSGITISGGIRDGSSNSTFAMIVTDRLTTSYQSGRAFGDACQYAVSSKKSADGKTIYWHTDGTTNNSTYAGYQCNTSGVTYYFLGIKI